MLKNAFVIKYASHVGKGNMHPAILDKKEKNSVVGNHLSKIPIKVDERNNLIHNTFDVKKYS